MIWSIVILICSLSSLLLQIPTCQVGGSMRVGVEERRGRGKDLGEKEGWSECPGPSAGKWVGKGGAWDLGQLH